MSPCPVEQAPALSGPLPQQVTICGGGNGAHVCAGYLGWKGVRVNVLTRRPQDWNNSIAITTEGSSWEAKGNFVGPINKVRTLCFVWCLRISWIHLAESPPSSP
jgi:hypothetical protein